MNLGVEYAMQSDEVKKKARLAYMNKYGVQHPMQNEEFKKSVQQTVIEKYNTDNVSKATSIKEKLRRIYCSTHIMPKDFSNNEIVS